MKKIADVKDFGQIIYSFDAFRAEDSSHFVTKYGHNPLKFERFELEFKNNTFSIAACDGYFLVKGVFSAETFEEKYFDISVKEKLTKKLCLNDLSDEIYLEEGNLISGNKVFVTYDVGKSFMEFPFKKDSGNFTVQNMFDSLVKVFNKEYIESLNYKKSNKKKQSTFEDDNFYISVNKNELVLLDVAQDKSLHTAIKSSNGIEDEVNFYLNKWMLYRVLKLFSEYNVEDITFFLDNKSTNYFSRVDVSIEGNNLLGIIAGVATRK